MSRSFGVGKEARSFLTCEDVIFQRTRILRVVKVIRDQRPKFFKAIDVKLGKSLPDTPMKFHALLDENRVVCGFLNQNMPERVFLMERFNQTHLSEILNL